MHCPKCNASPYNPAEACSSCGFTGDPGLIEERGHITWLFGQIDSWHEVAHTARQQLTTRYKQRLYEVETSLGLRQPRIAVAEAKKLWPDLIKRQILLARIAEWQEAGWLNEVATQPLVTQAEAQVAELTNKLEGHVPPIYPHSEADQLAVIDFLLEGVKFLSENDGFTSPNAEARLRQTILAVQNDINGQVVVGAAEDAPAPVAPEPAPQPGTKPAATPAPRPRPKPAEPQIPFRERFWQTLLSERTLQGMLYMGVFLLFAAGLSFVILGWENFSAPMRVAIPTAASAVFFGAGWYIRTSTTLYRSGIALSAIGAMLIPIDFYTIYINFDFAPAVWPQFWLVASVVCLAIYAFVALSSRAQIFGYLTGVAAGSNVLALNHIGNQSFGLSLDWQSAGLSILGAALLAIAARLPSDSDEGWTGRLRVFPAPFRALTLLGVAVLMLLTFAQRYIERSEYDTLHYALALNWWIGGFVLGWGAVRYRSRALSVVAAVALPIAAYLTQAAVFDAYGLSRGWHGVGFAALTWLYWTVGRRLAFVNAPVDAIRMMQSRTAMSVGTILLIVATIWPLSDLGNGLAIALSHGILAASVVGAARLWQRPWYLYGVSFLTLSAVTFGLTEFNLTLVQLSVAWVSVALGHIILVLNLGARLPDDAPDYLQPLVFGGFLIAELALLIASVPYEPPLSLYVFANWLGMAAWGAWLAHSKQRGFAFRFSLFGGGIDTVMLFQWWTALPLLVWVILLFDYLPALDIALPLALVALAYALTVLSYRLHSISVAYRRPWYVAAVLASIAAPLVAFGTVPDGVMFPTVISLVGLLYFMDAVVMRQRLEFVPGALVLGAGYLRYLDQLNAGFEGVSFGLAGLVGVYIVGGLLAERRYKLSGEFLQPLYIVTHCWTWVILAIIYIRIFDAPVWTDGIKLWGSATLLVLGVTYGLFAWGRYRVGWAHLAAWLGVGSGVFLGAAISRGHGAAAALAALGAINYVLAERGLRRAWHLPQVAERRRAIFRLMWRLYRRPLLVAGWTVSIGAIALAIGRNLFILEGTRTQQTWAVVALLLIVGLYGVSARLFLRPRFVWFAAIVMIAPWTILTNLGWYTGYQPTTTGFALSWVMLCAVMIVVAMAVFRSAGRVYGRPLLLTANALLPVSLLWAVADLDTSRYTFGLAIILYGFMAWLDYRRLVAAGTTQTDDTLIPGLAQARFLYPALGLVPVWLVYLVAWLFPEARHEHYGLLLLAFCPVMMVLAQRLKRVTAGYDLPAYLTGYVTLIVGTMLVAHLPNWLAVVLLYDALLLAVSAWLFRNPLWGYPAAALVPFSLLIAFNEAGIPANRQGWWLIGLATVYFGLAWTLRRLKLPAYSTATLAIGFALIALGLPPSSQDRVGALVGYGAAVVLYGVMGVWLRQPLLLALSCLLVSVPYAMTLQLWDVPAMYYGVLLLPGAVVVLSAGWTLDQRFGTGPNFPWETPSNWLTALADRLTEWWGFAPFVLGFSWAGASPFFTAGNLDLTALNWLLVMPLFAWATVYFRQRVWLLVTALAGHLAAVYYLAFLERWQMPAEAVLLFMPVTLLTFAVAMVIQWRLDGPLPITRQTLLTNWSSPLYLLVLIDMVTGQLLSLNGTWSGVTVTVIHALMLAGLAIAWRTPLLPYVSAALGIVAVTQSWIALDRVPNLATNFAQLTLGYGIIGYGIAWIRLNLPDDRDLRPWLGIWEVPLQHVSMALSFGVLLLSLLPGLDIFRGAVLASLGMSFREVVDIDNAWLMVGVGSLLGLYYLTVSVVHRWMRLSYLALGLLLASWLTHALFIQQWDTFARIQWYAIPAGLYLLVIGFLEWRQGHKSLARWLDYAAIFLMMGSLFWQTMLLGWSYALLLGAEGLLSFWWGSARRMRHFFYAGMVGVVLATLGQLINALSSINQWIVFGVVGLILVLAAIFVERKLEDIKTWSKVLDTWE